MRDFNSPTVTSGVCEVPAQKDFAMRPPSVFICLMLFLLAPPAWAEPADLSTLAAQLAKVRTTHGINQMRDAGPELTEVKHTLRAWVEQQLPAIPAPSGPYGITYSLDTDDLTDLSARLSQALDKAGLTCGRWGSPDFRCGGNAKDFESERGYVDRVRLAFFDDDRYLMILTGVGMRCGFDQSAYIYEQGADRHWHLRLSIEQDRYGDHDYRPENFVSIDVPISHTPQTGATPLPLVAAVGYSPWCSSKLEYAEHAALAGHVSDIVSEADPGSRRRTLYSYRPHCRGPTDRSRPARSI
jgi:hypothetical protein